MCQSLDSHPGPDSIEELLARSPWTELEKHLDGLGDRVDDSIRTACEVRGAYRDQLLRENPELAQRIQRPSRQALSAAESLLERGSVAAADGTVSAVPLLGGSKIQVGVVIVFNSGKLVSLVTRVFEVELTAGARDAREFFERLRSSRKVSNLVSRAIMLFGERRLLMDQDADWRMIHGELVPHELRTGAGRPRKNLPPTFDLINLYVSSERFLAVSESPDDLDILNAAIVLEPGEYLVIRSLEDTFRTFLEGDTETGQQRANFADVDARRFRQFMESAGPQVAVVLAKAGQRPFLLECHRNRVEEAVSLFFVDSLWTRGLESTGSTIAVRPFPYHLDLADRVAGTLFKGGDFQRFVETRLMDLGLEEGLFDIDPRRTRS